MLDGVMLLWFLETAISLAFVAIDIRTTPESPVMKWGFVLLTAFTGPLGAFLYVLGCREPLPGMHEQYVSAQWRQALGSTMHCVAGDGVGILTGAAVGSVLSLSPLADAALEYALGFAFGWMVFQALFMRDMLGGVYRSALKTTFMPEFLSMNTLMAGMAPTAALGWRLIGERAEPLDPRFWFVMSMALLVGFIVAYPMNWWLVARGLKHGMMTVSPEGGLAHAAMAEMGGGERDARHDHATPRHEHDMSTMSKKKHASPRDVAKMTALSVACLALGLFVSLMIAPS